MGGKSSMGLGMHLEQGCNPVALQRGKEFFKVIILNKLSWIQTSGSILHKYDT